MKNRQIYQLLAAVILISSCSCIELAVNLESRDAHCFYDSLGSMIVMQINILCDQGDHLKFTIKHPDQSILYEETAKKSILYKVVTDQEGDYEFCFENMDFSAMITVYFDYKTGVEAKDYADLISKEEGVKFQLSAQRLSDTLHDIGLEKKMILRHQQYNSALSNDLSFKIQGFSIITGALLLALGIFQSYYLRQFFKEKKMI